MASPPSKQVQVLSKILTARPLPSSELPDSPDLVAGSYTTRLGDAGECAFTYPNAISSDGVPWRTRFDPTGHLMFLEVWLGGELEQVCAIDTAAVSDGAGFSQTLDATDFASSLQGNGAGFQNGTAGQLQALVFDPATLDASLFDAQGWQDFSDASFAPLLQALLNSALGLRLTPWQLLSADGSAGGQGQVQVHGQDGWFLLKKAYERDWTVTQSPRDVIERGTQVWVPAVGESFPAGSAPQSASTSGNVVTPTETWTINSSGGATAMITPNGGALLSAPAGGTVQIASAAVAATSIWRTVFNVQTQAGQTSTNEVIASVLESSGDQYRVDFYEGTAQFFSPDLSTVIASVALPVAPNYTVLIESDGEWVWAFINGQLIGVQRRGHTSTTTLACDPGVSAGGTHGAGTATFTGILAATLQPLLMRGLDKGDYVLPGDASTYPSGGLHARYFNDLDLQSDPNALQKVLAPSRSQAYAGSGSAEYQNQQDATISGQANPTPGASASFWSCKWFGAIWLPLSKGDIALAVTGVARTGVKIWVGKTRWGDQLLDNCQTGIPAANYDDPFNVSSSALAGTLPYGGGSVKRDGWYPIVVEYIVTDVSAGAPNLYFQGPLPYTWTDPGGTTLTSGAAGGVGLVMAEVPFTRS